ncbi:radical SAM/SPASM domain-containing protein [Desulfomicrobium norvegicum]|nr:radical SAM protein [Desulfomicrobium norvegicum]
MTRLRWGVSFSQEEIENCKKKNGLLSMELELSRECNLRCIYCYAESGNPIADELSYEEILSAIDQAVELGAQKIVVLGGGEPLCYPGIFDVLNYIHAKSVEIELFTNGMLITKDAAQTFIRLGVKPVIKMNSFRPEIQDILAGQKGAFTAIRNGLTLLMEAGYPTRDLALGAQTVICRHNLEELPAMWIWLREHGIIPYFEMLTLQGRARRHPDLELNPEELQRIFETLADIDAQRFGNFWEPHPSVAAFCCDRHEYSCTVSVTGDIYPCPGVDIPAGNIRQAPLSDILRTSPLIHDLRNIRSNIKGMCAQCDLKAQCYGCRGMAYQATGDYLAADPLCWRNKTYHA